MQVNGQPTNVLHSEKSSHLRPTSVDIVVSVRFRLAAFLLLVLIFNVFFLLLRRLYSLFKHRSKVPTNGLCRQAVSLRSRTNFAKEQKKSISNDTILTLRGPASLRTWTGFVSNYFWTDDLALMNSLLMPTHLRFRVRFKLVYHIHYAACKDSSNTKVNHKNIDRFRLSLRS